MCLNFHYQAKFPSINDDANPGVGEGLPSVNSLNDIMSQKMLLLRANCNIKRSWNLEEDLKWAMNNSYRGKGKYTLFKMRNKIINIKSNYWYKGNSSCTPGILLHDANFALSHSVKLLTAIVQWVTQRCHNGLSAVSSDSWHRQSDGERKWISWDLVVWLLGWLLTAN